MEPQVQQLIEKLEHLSASRLAEVADFVDFLQQRDRDQSLKQDWTQASATAFEKTWNNDDDAAYDAL